MLLKVLILTGSITGGNLGENELDRQQSTGKLELFPSRVFLVHLAQLKRRTMTTNNPAGKRMMMKKSRDQDGPLVRKETAAGFYGGHNPSGRIRILKF